VKKEVLFISGSVLMLLLQLSTHAFEGTIETSLTRGNHSETVVYTMGTNQMHIARKETDRPYTQNIINLDTGEITLLFPRNGSYMRLAAPEKNRAPAGFPEMPLPPGGLPPGIGPQSGPAAAPRSTTPLNQPGPAHQPGWPEMPFAPEGMPTLPNDMGSQMQMPPIQIPPNGFGRQSAGVPPSEMSMPEMSPATLMPTHSPGMATMPPPDGMHPLPDDIDPAAGLPEGMAPPGHESFRQSRKLEFAATGQTTNIMGFACSGYQLTQRDQIMHIWATDQLGPFRPLLQDIPMHQNPMSHLEESWGKMLQQKNLFPVMATLKNRSGETNLTEFRIEIIKPERFGAENTLFQPPADYMEIPAPRHGMQGW
jgi:hypothetical protein